MSSISTVPQQIAAKSSAPSIDGLGLLAALAAALMWASAFVGIRVGLEGYGPESLALLRYLVASGLLLGLALARRMPLPELRDLPRLALSGFLGFTVYNVALNAGEMGVSAGVASFVVASAPVFVLIIGRLGFGERINRYGVLGISICMGGVLFISMAQADGFSLNARVLLLILAAVSWAFYSLGQRGLVRKYGTMLFLTYAIFFGTLFLLPFTPRMLADLGAASFEATAAVIYMGIVPGFIGYAAWSLALTRLPAARAASILYFSPIATTLIAWVWLGEVPGISSLIGGLLVLLGVIIVNTRGRA